MQISKKDWNNYIKHMSILCEEAAEEIAKWVQKNGLKNRNALIRYANAIINKYSEAASELACEMYDAVALLSGKKVPSAIPIEPSSYSETAKQINGCLNQSPSGQLVNSTVSRMVKLAGADTMLTNAKRDGAMVAWIPSGDTCPFCLGLASKGWKHVTSGMINNGHAEHIHSNCNCEYGIKFDEKSTYEAYNPEEYKEQYAEAEGKTEEEKLNALRRAIYQQNKDRINAQHREAYLLRNENEEG